MVSNRAPVGRRSQAVWLFVLKRITQVLMVVRSERRHLLTSSPGYAADGAAQDPAGQAGQTACQQVAQGRAQKSRVLQGREGVRGAGHQCAEASLMPVGSLWG